MSLLVKRAKISVTLWVVWIFSCIQVTGQNVDSLKRLANVLAPSDSLKMIRDDSGKLNTSFQVKAYNLALQEIRRGTSAALKTERWKPPNPTLQLSSKKDTLIYSVWKHILTIPRHRELTSLKTPWKAQQRVHTVSQMVSATIDTIKRDINGKVGGISRESRTLLGSRNPLLNLNPISINQNLEIPKIEILDSASPLKDVDASGIVGKVNAGDLTNVSHVNLGETKDLQEATGIRGTVEEVTKVGHQMEGYQEDLKHLKNGDLTKMQRLPDIIESKVEDLEEVESLQKASQEFAAIKAKWNDPEALKEQALNQAKESAVNHFAGHEEELKAAMEKLAKLKARIPHPDGAIDLFAKRQKFMQEKPLRERIVPGVAFQFQKQDSYWVDLNPYLGFKISGRWLSGLGWNERIAYNFDDREWDKDNRIFGLRGFVHFKLRTNLWLKADVENMNAPVRATPMMTSEIVGRGWIWSYFAGVKKDIQLSKTVKTSVQTLYNIYNPDKKSPYANRLNIRIGFEMDLKKRKKNR